MHVAAHIHAHTRIGLHVELKQKPINAKTVRKYQRRIQKSTDLTDNTKCQAFILTSSQ